MAHKAMIGGAVYEVGGGKDMIGGAVYEKDHGKDMIGGAVYELGFAEMVTVTITGNGSTYAHVVIDGVTYNTATTIEVPIGTVITCVATGNLGNLLKSIIKYNYETVASDYSAQYEYTAISDVTIVLSYVNARPGYTGYNYGTIDIADAYAPDWPLVSITGVAMSGSAYVQIDGATYTSPKEIRVPVGTVVTCYAKYSTANSGSTTGGYVYLNGETVFQGGGNYDYTVNGDVQITMEYSVRGGSSGMVYVGNIRITEL